MSRNLSILTLAITLLFCLSANAKQRTTEEMKVIAAKALAGDNKTVIGIRPAEAGQSLQVLKTTEQATILGYRGGRFVVVANDDSFNAVLACSDGNAAYSDNLPDGFVWWLNAIDETLKENLREGHNSPSAYGIGDGFGDGTATNVDPLLSCEWGQGEPFNMYCPKDYDDKLCPVGCVATAMAMTMFTYKYPERGAGSMSYVWTKGNGSAQRLEQDFSENVYNWSAMPNKLSFKWSEETSVALATLSRDCGYSVRMNYGSDGSGSFCPLIKPAMINNFGYNEGMIFYRREYFSADEWQEVLKAELDAGRPVIYGAQSPSSVGQADAGHCFVIDGYNKGGLFHVNWGWSGSSNCYADIAVLQPKGTSYKYTNGQEATIGICPQNIGEKTIQLYSSEMVLKLDGNSMSTSLSILNTEGLAFNGTRSLMLKNTETGEETALNPKDFQMDGIKVTANGASTSSKLATFSATLPDDLAPGTYRAYVAMRCSGSSKWVPVRYYAGNANSYLLTKDAQGNITSQSDSEMGWLSAIRNATVDGRHTAFKGVYNLQGQRVSEDFKGVIIKNGKKTINK